MAETLTTTTFADEPFSPEWWLKKLDRKLLDQRSQYDTYAAYYDGNHPLAFASDRFRQAFGGLFKEFADNWCDLVVDAVRERLKITGFRLGEKVEGDKDAWAIWQQNALDADSQIAHSEALIHGNASVLVWRGADGEPEITIEHPTQMIVVHEAGSRRRRRAALKRWLDDDGTEMATLYLPESVYKFQSATRRNIDTYMGGSSAVSNWIPRQLPASEMNPMPNPLRVVPVVPLLNRPSLLSDMGTSELHKVIPIQNAVNKLVADMLVASEFGAFRQRWATGLDVPRDPDTGQPVEPFKAAVDRLWITKSTDASFGEFGETNLANFVTAIEMAVQHIASQTRTPPHYFYLKGEFPSGESIKAAETGLVAKAVEKQLFYGEAWEEVMRLAFKVNNDTRAGVMDSEIIWGDPESRSESEHVDALVKQQALGVPNEVLWEKAGYSPQEITRIKGLKAAEALTMAAFPPVAPNPQEIDAQEPRVPATE